MRSWRTRCFSAAAELVVCMCISDCKPTLNGRTYLGKISITNTSKPCVNWTYAMITFNVQLSADPFPDGDGHAAKDYCRNPTNPFTPAKGYHTGLWCYVDHSNPSGHPTLTVGYCDVPLCGEYTIDVKKTFITFLFFKYKCYFLFVNKRTPFLRFHSPSA